MAQWALCACVQAGPAGPPLPLRGIVPAALVLNAVNPIMVQGAAFADFTMISGFDLDITEAIASGAMVTVSNALAQAPVELKFSRVMDLTLPIETNMAGIPGFKIYADNPSQVAIIAAMTEGQKEMLRSEGMTLSNNVEINGRSMTAPPPGPTPSPLAPRVCAS
jgi:hypothetical protein